MIDYTDSSIFDEKFETKTNRLLKDDVYIQTFILLDELLKNSSSDKIFDAIISTVDDESLVKICKLLKKK